MDRIVITSNDKELIDAIWSFQIQDDGLEDWAAKLIQTHQPAKLTICLREGDSIPDFVASERPAWYENSGIYGWFTEGVDTADLKQAKELLKGLP